MISTFRYCSVPVQKCREKIHVLSIDNHTALTGFIRMNMLFSKNIVLVFVCLFFSSVVYSQSCPTTIKNPWQWPSHSNWFFGNGNIGKFSGGTLTVKTFPSVVSYEGTSGASDDYGNLLFFANGRLLWDASGALKYSGLLTGNEGFMTSGSASQGIITVRHPLDPEKYYVFTVDDANQGTTSGLNYFVFDKNGNLKSGPTRLGGYRTAEGITATSHDNGVDLWVTAYASGTTNFYTYLITCKGVVSSPVISPVAPNFSGQKERGGLAFSWDGKYFAQVHPDYYPDSDKETSVYKFDKKTGIISDPHHISDPSGGESSYDVLFSPDNSKLYVSTAVGSLGYYDLSSWNTATMLASYKLVPGVSTGSHSAIELGGDGSIYMASLGDNLGKISGNVNTGSLTYSQVAGAVTARGLPTMYLPPAEEPDIKEAGPFCRTDPAVDLSTTWICSNLNAEDSIAYPDSYWGNGITNTGTGIFNPGTAGVGTHMIIFTRCSVDDTIYIAVKECACPDTSLKNIPPICANGSINLDSYKLTAEPGTWTITTTPPGSTATIVVNVFYANNTPAGSYTVRYTLKNVPGGCPPFAERIIIVHPVPDVSAVGDTICPGQPAQLTATGANTYTWSIGGTGATVSVHPTSTTTYTVIGTATGGCTDTATVTVIVKPAPVLTAVSASVCRGTSATLTVSGADTYTWSPPDGLNTTTGDSVISSADITTTYTITGTSATNICPGITTATITVNSIPKADFTIKEACEGITTLFTNVSTVTPGTIIFHAWDFGDGTTGSTIANPTHTFSSTGTFTVTLVVKSDGGCSDTIRKPVTVYPAPVVNFGPYAKGCAPICVNFKDSSTTPGVSVAEWLWNLGDGYFSSDQNPSHCYTKPGSYNISLTITSDKGCAKTKTINSLVNVYPIPHADFTSSPNPTSILDPKIYFKDLSTGGVVSWEWTFSDYKQDSVTTSTIQNPIYLYSDTGSYQVQLVVKNRYDCIDTIRKDIVILPHWTFYIPNAFTPNKNGVNDGFIGKSTNVIEHEMWIFDRWGNLIYTTGQTISPELAVPWNGKANNGAVTAQEDVYVWVVEITDILGGLHKFVGSVTLIR